MRFWRDVSGEITVSPLPASLVDVAVVGAGFTGLTTALLLARTGRRVAVVEARHVGAGASGATTAKTSLLQNTRLTDLADQHSPEVAAQYLAANRHGLEWLTEFCTAHDVPVERTPAVTFATTDDGADAVRREYELARELGLDVELDEHPGEEFATHAALRLPEMLQLDPADLLVALCRALTEAGGTITDHTRVTGIDGTTLRTDAGDLRAGQVVLATASPILDTGRVTMSLSPERSYLGAYEVTGPLPEGMYISAESPTISVRAAAGRLLVGGQGHPTGQETRTQERLAALDAWAEHHFPGARRTHGWSAQDYHPVGGVPVVEKLSDGVVFAGGYSKWGMAAAPAAAHMLVNLLDGREPETFGDTTLSGTAGTTATTLAKAAGHAAAHLARAVTGGDTRGPDDSSTLDEGDAATGRAGARPVGEAVVDAKTCRVSLLCTHMGGPLAWNEAEQSWDCPLHGSRFTPEGRVIEGPAVKDLPQLPKDE